MRLFAMLLIIGGLGFHSGCNDTDNSPQSPRSADDQRQQARTDRELLLGTWEVTASVINGESAPADELLNMVIVFTPDLLKTRTLKGTDRQKYKLDPARTPKEIDLNSPDPDAPAEVTHFEGIYDLNGDSLRICLAKPGTPRPGQFTAPAGSERFIVVLQRQKD
jgi:uncharacterized protein (TIGR03067 family)